MFAEERRKGVLSELLREGRVEVASLATRYSVSEHTVRRDLGILEAQGYAQKTHGGAVTLTTTHLSLSARRQTLTEAKSRIGALGAGLIAQGQTVILEAGSTTYALARALRVRPLSIITNSLDIAYLYEEDPDVALIVLGGRWLPHERVLRSAANDVLNTYRAAWAILGACALHPETGVSVVSEADALFKRELMRSSLKTMVLADSSKREQVASYRVAPVSNVDVVVTDAAWPELEAVGVKVLYAA